MKTLVVGDLHLKQQFVLPRIDGMLLVMRKLGVSYFWATRAMTGVRTKPMS